MATTFEFLRDYGAFSSLVTSANASFGPRFHGRQLASNCGGRSRSLKVNYRTSHQIKRQSEGLLPETLVEADGSEENRLGVTSVFDGPAPVITTYPSRQAEVLSLSKWLQDLARDGLGKDEIAVLVRSNDVAEQIDANIGDLSNVLLMHDAKGAEFRAVAVIALDHDIIPDEERLLSARDEMQLDEVMVTERHLLYVAATRARDHLWMSGVEPVSEFLNDLMQK